MEPESSLPYSQVSATFNYSKHTKYRRLDAAIYTGWYEVNT